MKKDWSPNWNRSVQPRKQRKFIHNASLHIKQKFLHVNLSKDLRTKHGKRNIGIRKGDKVKIMRGTYKGKVGRVERVSLKYEKIYVEGIENIRKDGNKTMYPLKSSNLMIIELNLDDKRRKKCFERSKVVEKAQNKVEKKEAPKKEAPKEKKVEEKK